MAKSPHRPDLRRQANVSHRQRREAEAAKKAIEVVSKSIPNFTKCYCCRAQIWSRSLVQHLHTQEKHRRGKEQHRLDAPHEKSSSSTSSFTNPPNAFYNKNEPNKPDWALSNSPNNRKPYVQRFLHRMWLAWALREPWKKTKQI